MLTFILQPYSRVNTENPYPILDLFPDLLMLTGLQVRKVVVLPAVPIFKCQLPGNFLRLNFSSNSLVLRKMIPHSRPKLSDFYTLFQSNLAENHTLHSGTYLYSSYIAHINKNRNMKSQTKKTSYILIINPFEKVCYTTTELL